MTEKIQKILEDAKQELLAELTADQKRKYEKLIGESVDEKNDDDDKDRQRIKRRRK